MKFRFLLAVIVMLATPIVQSCTVQKRQIPCFPGATGFGSTTPGGRGGEILKVTNLNDSGPGSLRAALQKSGPRIVVFEVGGTIFLQEDLVISEPFLTLAGQTAPSPGITLCGAGLQISTNDIFVQHLRIRVGDLPGKVDPGNRDGLQLLGPETRNVIVDHVSVSWAVDENIGVWGGARDVTISNCIISEGLHDSIHPEGPHSMGMLIGDKSRNVAVLNNLFAHNNARNPRIKGDATVLVANNLIYNGGKRFVSIGSASGPNKVALVGNRIIPGPNTAEKTVGINIEDNVVPGTKVYLLDNSAPGLRNDLVIALVTVPPIWLETMDPEGSCSVDDRVLAHAGARPNDRDSVDTRIVQEVRLRQGRIINSPKDAGGFPEATQSTRSFLIPPNPGGDKNGDGYTNIEESLHEMANALEAE